MKDLSPEEMAEVFGKQVGQAHLVIRCVIRALVQTPGFDGRVFINLLAKEEMSMSENAQGAKESLKTIIAETEGYL